VPKFEKLQFWVLPKLRVAAAGQWMGLLNWHYMNKSLPMIQ
jgi:hypothetical protein